VDNIGGVRQAVPSFLFAGEASSLRWHRGAGVWWQWGRREVSANIVVKRLSKRPDVPRGSPAMLIAMHWPASASVDRCGCPSRRPGRIDSRPGIFSSMGINDGLTTDLSQISESLRDRAQIRAFTFKGKKCRRRQAGSAREIGFAHVLEEVVRRLGDQVSVNVQMIDGEKPARHGGGGPGSESRSPKLGGEAQSQINRAAPWSENAAHRTREGCVAPSMTGAIRQSRSPGRSFVMRGGAWVVQTLLCANRTGKLNRHSSGAIT